MNPRSSLSSLRGLLAAVMLGSMSAVAPGGIGLGMPTMPLRSPGRPVANKKIRTGGNRASTSSYPNGPGWGIRQVKRMAAKKRNQAKNRRNHRG